MELEKKIVGSYKKKLPKWKTAARTNPNYNNEPRKVDEETAVDDLAVAGKKILVTNTPKHFPFNTLPTLAQIKTNMEAEANKKKKDAWKAKKKDHTFESPDDASLNTSSTPIIDTKRKKITPNKANASLNNMEMTSVKRFKDLNVTSQEQLANIPIPMANDTLEYSSAGTMHDILKKTMQDLGVNNLWYVNPRGASGTAGGLALLWKSNIYIEMLDYFINHINAIIRTSNSPPWLFTGYYGNPYDTISKLNSWKMLDQSAASNNFHLLVIGDFNFILHDTEKFSTHSIDANEASILNEKILNLDLIDLGFTGFPFTWSNKRKGHALTEQRLDGGLENDDWLAIYPNTTITNMLAIGSDHHPNLLKSNPHWKNGKIPFKFFGTWLDHADCRKIIADCWKKITPGSSAFTIAIKLKDIKLQIRVWNKEVYGNIKTNIDECKQYLYWIHTHYFREDRGHALADARKQLKNWQDIEEKFWKTKSRD
ncbi:uncharacterized protein LOC113305210 [Papaver somniferum]|uniref:uncharacterized protein LOC113305210 n=1 Tax=Papaver somniferum TaxID=3469 RepID=UPI000E6F4952|nr:uncharacterized protein LOC113305210 [Papaver somniferum]